jgi:hypothetical protein
MTMTRIKTFNLPLQFHWDLQSFNGVNGPLLLQLCTYINVFSRGKNRYWTFDHFQVLSYVCTSVWTFYVHNRAVLHKLKWKGCHRLRQRNRRSWVRNSPWHQVFRTFYNAMLYFVTLYVFEWNEFRKCFKK